MPEGNASVRPVVTTLEPFLISLESLIPSTKYVLFFLLYDERRPYILLSSTSIFTDILFIDSSVESNFTY